jgi:hypothetical protein
MRRALAVTLGLAIALPAGAGGARAQGDPIARAATGSAAAQGKAAAAPTKVPVARAVTWRAPAGCPAAASVTARIAQHLGEDAVPAGVAIAAVVKRRGGRWHLTLRLRTAEGEGERKVEAASCAELAETAALIVALAIDPDLRLPGPTPAAPPDLAPDGTPRPAAGGELGAAAASPEAAAPAAAADKRVAAAGPVDDETPPDRSASAVTRAPPDVVRFAGQPPGASLRFAAFAAGDIGSLPGTAAGGGGAIDVGLGRWRLGVTGSLWREQRITLAPSFPSELPKGADVSLLSTAFRICRDMVLLGAAGTWQMCGGPELEVLRGRRFDSGTAAGGGSQTGGGAMAAAAYLWPLNRNVSLRIDLQIVGMVVRPGFYERSTGERIYVMGWVLGRSFASLEVAIP